MRKAHYPARTHRPAYRLDTVNLGHYEVITESSTVSLATHIWATNSGHNGPKPHDQTGQVSACHEPKTGLF